MTSQELQAWVSAGASLIPLVMTIQQFVALARAHQGGMTNDELNTILAGIVADASARKALADADAEQARLDAEASDPTDVP